MGIRNAYQFLSYAKQKLPVLESFLQVLKTNLRLGDEHSTFAQFLNYMTYLIPLCYPKNLKIMYILVLVFSIFKVCFSSIT